MTLKPVREPPVRKRLRVRRARDHGYTEPATTGQRAAEFDGTIPRSANDAPGRTHRVAVKRQHVDIREGQDHRFTEYHDRFVITDIPRFPMDPAGVSPCAPSMFDRLEAQVLYPG